MNPAALLAAKCASCGTEFHHASFGDFAHGEAVLSTSDGRCFARASAGSDFAQRVAKLLTGHDRTIWPFLAALADPIDGMPMTHRIVCPACRSTDLESWGGTRLGLTEIPDVTFTASERLSTTELAARLAAIQRELPGD